MRRQLTAREWMLLALLGIILLISGYILLFYTPMTTERDRCISETESVRMQTEAAQLRLDDKHRMERELEELFASDPPPLSIPDYDNLKPVMFEMNTILVGTKNYSLTFSTVDTSQAIVRRSIAMNFTTSSYESAKEVLRQLHDSGYRCMLDNVNLGITQAHGLGMDYVEGGDISVNGNIVFFEYQAAPLSQAQQNAG